MIGFDNQLLNNCPYPLTMALERFHTPDGLKHSTLIVYRDDEQTKTLQQWFNFYNARQLIEAGIKEGNVVASVQTQRPHLVVLPPTLLFNWEQEITRFYPDLRIHFYTGKERRTVFKDCDVVLTTYGLVRRDIHQLEKIPFHVIIFDEAQAIKNIYADTTGAVRRRCPRGTVT